MQAVVVTCNDIPADLLNDFEYKSYRVEGECCEKNEQIACKVEGQVYEVNETWPSPDGDKCKTFTCVDKDNKLSKQVSLEKCKKECSKVGHNFNFM